jgi:fibronectin-binding autotransporter adhesin
MSLKFLNLNVENNTVRPTGYKFPVGLTGGNTGVASTDIVRTTPSPGNYTFPGTAASGSAEVLVIGGGGGGGSTLGGGGGGGGLVYHSAYPFSAGQSVSTTVGSGGITYSAPGGPPSTGPTSTKGANTTFGSITAIGGGAGKADGGGGGSTTNLEGGSSGGANYYGGPVGGTSGGTVQQGPSGGGTGYGSAGAGGSGFNPANPGGNYQLGGGGGGGAGGAAQTNPTAAPDAPYKASSGNAGAGLAFSLVGSPVNYSGGGGGQYQHRAGSPSNGQTIDGTSANNTASFGLGATAQLLNGPGGAMPGVVIVKYYTNSYNID